MQEPDSREPAATPLLLELRLDDDDPVLVAAGEIDVATSPLLRAELAGLLARNPDRVTLDFAEVSFIDSSGLGVLVGALKRVRERDAAENSDPLRTRPRSQGLRDHGARWSLRAQGLTAAGP